ncbi:hypothetical protein HPB51_002537 [Rhipicephalus microplus]|uniref:Uncharacterized protein n=1 Tax=Rhipicephalus microplus TaxID=6941 RepID=A0A9J6DEK4_RHIMP|nr:hypothetical protein HPB51_002537 [Rhipicephalus microplus]
MPENVTKPTCSTAVAKHERSQKASVLFFLARPTLFLSEQVFGIYKEVFGEASLERPPEVHMTPKWLSVGSAILPRRSPTQDPSLSCRALEDLRLLHIQAPAMEGLAKCLENGLAALLVSPSGSGKTTLVRSMARLTGHPLAVLPIGTSTDALELLGSFEQGRLKRQVCCQVVNSYEQALHNAAPNAWITLKAKRSHFRRFVERQEKACKSSHLPS